MKSTVRNLFRQLREIRKNASPCPGPSISIREGTREELAAMPPYPRECPVCGQEHGYDGIRYISIVFPPPEGNPPDTPFCEVVPLNTEGN